MGYDAWDLQCAKDIEEQIKEIEEREKREKLKEPEESDCYGISRGLDEYNTGIKQTISEKKQIILTHIMYDQSITDLCKSIGCSRDFYYSVKRKAEAVSGTVDYRLLTFPDEEW